MKIFILLFGGLCSLKEIIDFEGFMGFSAFKSRLSHQKEYVSIWLHTLFLSDLKRLAYLILKCYIISY